MNRRRSATRNVQAGNMKRPTSAQVRRCRETRDRRAKDLDELIDVIGDLVESARYAPEISTAGVAMYLQEEHSPKACAEMLACAVLRFVALHEDIGDIRPALALVTSGRTTDARR